MPTPAIKSPTRKRIVDNIVKKPYYEALKAIQDLSQDLDKKPKDKAKELEELLKIAEDMVREKRKKTLINKIVSKFNSFKKK
jgi:DNA-directed RNA polymerase specialized sigma subunit